MIFGKFFDKIRKQESPGQTQPKSEAYLKFKEIKAKRKLEATL